MGPDPRLATKASSAVTLDKPRSVSRSPMRPHRCSNCSATSSPGGSPQSSLCNRTVACRHSRKTKFARLPPRPPKRYWRYQCLTETIRERPVLSGVVIPGARHKRRNLVESYLSQCRLDTVRPSAAAPGKLVRAIQNTIRPYRPPITSGARCSRVWASESARILVFDYAFENRTHFHSSEDGPSDGSICQTN